MIEEQLSEVSRERLWFEAEVTEFVRDAGRCSVSLPLRCAIAARAAAAGLGSLPLHSDQSVQTSLALSKIKIDCIFLS